MHVREKKKYVEQVFREKRIRMNVSMLIGMERPVIIVDEKPIYHQGLDIQR